MGRLATITLLGLLAAAPNALAQDKLSDCTETLKPALSTKNYTFFDSVYLATKVTHDQWDEKHKNAGVDFPLYDIPVGAKYED